LILGSGRQFRTPRAKGPIHASLGAAYHNTNFKFSHKEKAGILSGDSTLRHIQSTLQKQIVQSVSNRFTSYRVVSQVGLIFNRDGSLSLDESRLRSALTDDFTAVAALFLGDGASQGGNTASDGRVTYNGKTSTTQAGTYSMQIESLGEQASAVGA
jgi:flagellar hook-associated protein 2